MAFPAVFNVDLPSLTGLNGFKLTSSTSSSFGLGHSVASAGDLNGDGIQDLVIGTYGADSAYIVYGNHSTFQTPFSVDSLLTGSNGFKLIGTSEDFGISVASAGDFNGDGISDIVIGSYYSGIAYVIYGSNSAFQNPYNVDSLLTGSNGFKLTSMYGYFGSSVASAGDFNGDTIADIVIGAEAFAVYVIYGSRNSFQTPFNVDSLLTGSNGFKITSTSAWFGRSVASAGDFNGDGLQDIIIGTNCGDPCPKASYVIFGSRSAFTTPFNVDFALNGINGFELTSTSFNFGTTVSSAGDFNGDGIQDIIVGAPNANAAYIVFGSRSTFTNPFPVDSLLTGSNGFKLTSVSGRIGYIGSAGDFDGDGLHDILLGAPNINAAYVVFGSRSAFANPFAIDALLTGLNGFKFTSTSSSFGAPVTGAGDLNGDRIQDIAIAAPSVSTTYVIFGKHYTDRGIFPSVFNTANLDGVTGFNMDGEGQMGFGGSPATSIGDFNGDGLSDFVMCTHQENNKAYILFGKRRFSNFDVTPLTINGDNGFIIIGKEGSGFCRSVSGIGDFNKDGYDDLIIGSQFSEGTAQAYVVFGKPRGFSNINAQELSGSNGGFIMSIPGYTAFGFSVSGIGDINGDRYPDLIVGACYVDKAYVLFGRGGYLFKH